MQFAMKDGSATSEQFFDRRAAERPDENDHERLRVGGQ